MTIKVGVLGAVGRMGVTVCDAVESDPELELVARIDPAGGDGVLTSLDDLGGAEVVVDFTRPSSVMENIKSCVGKGVHCVVGTTGLTEANIQEIAELVDGGKSNVFIAPNFSLGAVLLMHLAKQAARYLGSVEIVELHHNQKLDAPSGTAMKTARDIAEVWKEHGRPTGGLAHPDEEETVTGARGAVVEGINVHAVRLHGLLAHEEVLFGAQGQTLSIRHDSIDRSSFMPGVLLAVKKVSSTPGLTVGLENLLDL